jgi:hypothetical protein
VAGTGHPRIMQPSTDPQPLAQVTVGMTVVDAAGAEVGAVTAVQTPGTEVRPDAPAGIAEHLMSAGYVRIDGTGFLTNDVYAAGDEITEVVEAGPGVVNLRVPREELARVEA